MAKKPDIGNMGSMGSTSSAGNIGSMGSFGNVGGVSYGSPGLPGSTSRAAVGNGFIRKQIDRSNRNIIIWNVLILLVVVAVFAFPWRYWYNFWMGARAITPAELARIKDPDKLLRNWVHVRGEEPEKIETITTTEKGRTRVSAYVEVLKIDDNYVTAKIPNGPLLDSFDAAMESGNRWSATSTAYIRSLGESPNKLLPISLDATELRLPGIMGLIFCVPLGLLALWNLKKGISRSSNPLKHPIIKALTPYGPLESTVSNIDEEVSAAQLAAASATPGKKAKKKKTVVTKNWIVAPTTFGAAIMRLADLAWYYMRVVSNHGAKSYYIVLFDRSGRKSQISGSHKVVDQTLTELATAAPWAIPSYSADLAATWKKDRAKFLTAIDMRKQELAKAATAPPA